MFRIEINAGIFKDAIETVSTLVDESRLRFNPDGISINAVDPSNVAMVSLELQKEAFITYECDEGEIGLDLIKFSNILSMADSGGIILMEIDEKSHKLKIEMDGLKYLISLLDPSSIRKEPKVPNLELPCQVEITGAVLKTAIKASDKISDHISFIVDGDNFVMEAEGDTDRVRMEFEKDELLGIIGGSASSLFSLDYLSDMNKAISKIPQITLKLGNEYPLKIDFKIADGYGSVGYLLAPRIESPD